MLTETKVVNIRHDHYDVYCGRGSKWGNNYKIGEDGNREEVINKYRKYFYDKVQSGEFSKQELLKLKGKRLGCFCKPKSCHVDIIADYVNTLDSTTFKVIVAGSRNFYDYDFVKSKLDILFSKIDKSIEIISGGAKGVDSLGEKYSLEQLGEKATIFNALWDDIEGKPKNEIKINSSGNPYWIKAGFERNTTMLNYADALVAFRKNNSSGTTDMIEKSKIKGLQIRVYDVE